MLKRLLTIVLTLFVLIALSLGIAYFTDTAFIDYAFLVGLAGSVIFWFSTSKGGFTSRNLDMNVQGSTGIKVEAQKYEFSPNLAFFAAVGYTVIMFIAMLIHYRSYL
ncbi:hypothetical protein [Neobacillus jeddahensis]|uniref:hypothetical protein n=1 Tax=Neobacillus jeddahensis TaxID=1461580 RepID=UPI00058DE735|nr:hypothetical protein [Neobacillus jeddahensis]